MILTMASSRAAIFLTPVLSLTAAIPNQVLGFGDEIKVKPVPHKAALDFLDRYFDQERQNPAGTR
jgi:hypothetical protein